jgi:two-component system sensor histidine kinase CiaH
MFHSATLRLTSLYVLVLAIICLFFSVNLYRVSTRELDIGLGRQMMFLQRAPRFQDLINDDFVFQRQTQLTEAKRRIIFELVNVDIFIILVGGVGCYFLARRTLRPIQDAHNAQVRFTSDASHELRTPLSVMQTEIEVALRDKNLTLKELKRLLESNLEELSKLTNLSEGLLKLARNGEKLELKKVSLETIVDQAINRVIDSAQKKKITIDNQTTNEPVFGDEASLIQLVTIILDNAIKYSDQGKKVIITSASADKHTILKFEDQGMGIGQTDLPHIFDRFYRAEESRSKEKIPGYGLGLPIAQKIVVAHGGTIVASSNPDVGSVFTIKLKSS